ncbi:hypothetical protein BUALT_Bualt10G0038800 [Buddleja alternifolia]|uniref:Uncharacterized protein n=1 Tax=Buddleja alternifolia TaxID=168488 RepID=A0AAV6WXC6_9LAMI|nr:hypothetical protein BUALT_Bualt10G0038800 [Buddleja alternifolia]
MEPICGQAFGVQRFKLLGLTIQRTILLLLLTSVHIAFLWLNMNKILILCGQDHDIAMEAQSYIIFSLPDLISLSFLHPLRIYLRAQSITLPLTYCVALAGVWTNFNLVLSLTMFVVLSGVYKKTWPEISSECMKGWRSLLSLAIPSYISVCLEWWWYEIMTLLCRILINPRATVASMGILIQATSLIYIFPFSLSFGVSTRVGNEFGAGRPKNARISAIVGLCTSFFLGFSALSFAFSVRKIWGSLFTQDEEILGLPSMVLPIIGLCELGNCPQTTGCGVLRGTARPKMGANINLGCFYLVGMPVAVLLSFFFEYDFKGLWIGLLAAEGCCAVVMLFVLVTTDWELQAFRAKELTGKNSSGVGDILLECSDEIVDSLGSLDYTKVDDCHA